MGGFGWRRRGEGRGMKGSQGKGRGWLVGVGRYPRGFWNLPVRVSLSERAWFRQHSIPWSSSIL